MALFVELAVEFAWRQAVWPRWDDSRFAGARQGLEDPGVGVKGFVGDQLLAGHGRQQGIGAGQIVRLSSHQQKCQRIAERVDQGVDLGVLGPPRLWPIA